MTDQHQRGVEMETCGQFRQSDYHQGYCRLRDGHSGPCRIFVGHKLKGEEAEEIAGFEAYLRARGRLEFHGTFREWRDQPTT